MAKPASRLRAARARTLPGRTMNLTRRGSRMRHWGELDGRLARFESCEAAAEHINRRLAMLRHPNWRFIIVVGFCAVDWAPVTFPRAIYDLAGKCCGVRACVRPIVRSPIGGHELVCTYRTGNHQDIRETVQRKRLHTHDSIQNCAPLISYAMPRACLLIHVKACENRTSI
jgi:hypothetical protein